MGEKTINTTRAHPTVDFPRAPIVNPVSRQVGPTVCTRGPSRNASAITRLSVRFTLQLDNYTRIRRGVARDRTVSRSISDRIMSSAPSRRENASRKRAKFTVCLYFFFLFFFKFILSTLLWTVFEQTSTTYNVYLQRDDERGTIRGERERVIE